MKGSSVFANPIVLRFHVFRSADEKRAFYSAFSYGSVLFRSYWNLVQPHRTHGITPYILTWMACQSKGERISAYLSLFLSYMLYSRLHVWLTVRGKRLVYYKWFYIVSKDIPSEDFRRCIDKQQLLIWNCKIFCGIGSSLLRFFFSHCFRP